MYFKFVKPFPQLIPVYATAVYILFYNIYIYIVIISRKAINIMIKPIRYLLKIYIIFSRSLHHRINSISNEYRYEQPHYRFLSIITGISAGTNPQRQWQFVQTIWHQIFSNNGQIRIGTRVKRTEVNAQHPKKFGYIWF